MSDVFVSIWQARDRVSAFAVNASIEGATAAAQAYADRVNAMNGGAFQLRPVSPDAEFQVAMWRDVSMTHAIFIVRKTVNP